MSVSDHAGAFWSRLEAIRDEMQREDRAATIEDREELRRLHAEWEKARFEEWSERQKRNQSIQWMPMERYPDPPVAIETVMQELSSKPVRTTPTTVVLSGESVRDLAVAVTAERTGGATKTRRKGDGHAGGAPFKLWPRVAVAEATRLWVTRAYGGSIRAIAKAVTAKVITDVSEEELASHGWSEKPFEFTRDAMKLVTDAIGDGSLEWDDRRGLGVFHQFSTTPGWIAIPRRKPAS